MPYLRHDIYSYVSNQLYGKAGDEVVIVADHDNVLILEGKDGNRFPVITTSLTDMSGDKDQAFVPPVFNQVPAKKLGKIKKGAANTQTLF